MRYLFIFILFLSNFANSQELNFNIKKLLDGFDSVNKSTEKRTYCSEGDSGVSGGEHLQQCTIALCGEASKLKNAQFTNSSANEYIKPDSLLKYEKHEAKVNRVIDRALEIKSDLLKRFHTIANESDFDWKSLNLNDEEFDKLSDSVYSDYLNVNVKSEGPITERIKFKIINTENSPQQFVNGLRHYKKEKEKAYTENYLYSLNYGIYTVGEARIILQKKWKEFRSYYNKKLTEDENFLDSAWKDQVDTIRDNVYADAYLIGEDIIYDLAFIAHVSELINMPGRIDNLKNVSLCKSEQCRNGVLLSLKNKELRDSQETYNIKTKEEISEQADLFYSHCKSEYLLSNRIDYNKDEIRKRIPLLINKLVKTVSQFSSNESSAKIQKHFEDDINFSLNLVESDEDIEGTFTTEIGAATTLIDGIPNNYNNRNISEVVSDLLKLKDISYMCDLKSDGIVWDRFIYEGRETKNYHRTDYNPEKNNILISQFSCIHEEYGEGIIIHELGHALSHFLLNNKVSADTYKWYLDKRQCVTNNYKNKSIPRSDEFTHNNDRFRSEEDMADYIHSLTRINGNNKELLTCAMLSVSSNSKAYLGLSLEAEKKDPHSSGLMRVIMEALIIGKEIPDSCEILISSNKDRFGFKKCI